MAQVDYPALLKEAWQQAMAPREANAPTVISTFAGGGGSTLGYLVAGYRELLAVEWDRNAAGTLRRNVPTLDVYHGDIAALTVADVLARTGLAPGELDVLDGSPPCQGFSISGKRKMGDSRNQLYHEYVRLLQGLRPKVFVMENVSGLVKGKMKLLFADMMRDLKESGYRVACRLLNAAYFQVPQRRQRLIFIGVRRDLEREPTHPKAAHRPIPLLQALRDCPDGVSQGPFTGERLALARRIAPGTNGAAVTGKNGFNLVRLAWHRPSPTVLKTVGRAYSSFGGGLIHPDAHRHLTIPELKRIGSFPDEYQLEGRFEVQWERIGNAVPPLLMRAIARHVRETILQGQPAGNTIPEGSP